MLVGLPFEAIQLVVTQIEDLQPEIVQFLALQPEFAQLLAGLPLAILLAFWEPQVARPPAAALLAIL